MPTSSQRELEKHMVNLHYYDIYNLHTNTHNKRMNTINERKHTTACI